MSGHLDSLLYTFNSTKDNAVQTLASKPRASAIDKQRKQLLFRVLQVRWKEAHRTHLIFFVILLAHRDLVLIALHARDFGGAVGFVRSRLHGVLDAAPSEGAINGSGGLDEDLLEALVWSVVLLGGTGLFDGLSLMGPGCCGLGRYDTLVLSCSERAPGGDAVGRNGSGR